MKIHSNIKYLDFPVTLNDSLNTNFLEFKDNILSNLEPKFYYGVLITYNGSLLSKGGVPFDPISFIFYLDEARASKNYKGKSKERLSLDEHLQFLLIQLENKIKRSDLLREICMNSDRDYSY
jgi:hypothetical protein